MQELRDIFGIWPSIQAMAEEIGEEPDTVKQWRTRARIPERVWPAIIEKAALKEVLITASMLLALNKAPKMRGKPAHKIRSEIRAA